MQRLKPLELTKVLGLERLDPINNEAETTLGALIACVSGRPIQEEKDACCRRLHHYEIAPPDPIEAIKEQLGLKTTDLAKILGGRTRVSEVLNRKRNLSVLAGNRKFNPWSARSAKKQAKKGQPLISVTVKKLSPVRSRIKGLALEHAA